MKTELKAKFLQHLLGKKKDNQGFTLIELLVVIIIIGILAAIALPSFLNQANKARQSEARNYVGSINRAQQAFYLEKQQFAPNLANAAVGIPLETANYGYGIIRQGAKGETGQFAFAFGLPKGTAAVAAGSITSTDADTFAAATGSPLKGYVGTTVVVTPDGSTDANTLALLCEQNTAGVNAASALVDFTTTTGALAITNTTNLPPACVNPTATNGFSPLS